MRRVFVLLAATALLAEPIVEVVATRIGDAPLLSPSTGWMSFGVFNPTATWAAGKTVLLFRAQDANHTSRIGYAESIGGSQFQIRPEPVMSPETDYEKGGGLEDPRVVRIQGTYYLTYTGYNLHDAQLCLATSQDLIHWQRKGVIMPAYKGTWNEQWTKSGAILPQQVNGKWWMYYLGTKKGSDGKPRDYMGLAASDDLLHWKDATDKPVLDRRPGEFDSRVTEPGPHPFMTSAGILLFYNGANENLVYGPGWVLFDDHDPSRVIVRADEPFILPTLEWEKIGNVPNVIFLEGALYTPIFTLLPYRGPLTFTAYYGAADKYIGALKLRVQVPGHYLQPPRPY